MAKPGGDKSKLAAPGKNSASNRSYNRRDSQSSQSEVQSPALTRRNDGSSKPKSTGKKNSSKSESETSVLKASKQVTDDPILNLVDDILNEPPPSLVHTHRDKKSCPCDRSYVTSWKLDCSKCGQYWHTACVGLEELDEKELNILVNWVCPLCWVSPISIKRHNDDQLCYICRNTLSLQQSNFEFESSIGSQKVRDISKCCTTLGRINFVEFKKRIDALSQFDVRLQHLLLRDTSLRTLDSNIQKVDKSLSEFPSDQLRAVTSNNESLSKCISELQHDIKLLQQPSNPQTHAASSASSDKLLQDISEKLDKLSHDEARITTGLEQLKQSFESAQSNQHQQPAHATNAPSGPPGPDPSFHVHPSRLSPNTEPETPSVPHRQVPVSDTKPEFLEQTEAAELLKFLDESAFKDENGHSVMSFGAPYQYTGSRSSSDVPPFPECLKPLLKRINTLQSEIYGSLYSSQRNLTAPVINSCLINRYVGPESYLPRHSDRESSIHPESSIFTISLGQGCDIKFTERASGTESTHSCSDRSLYIMSRRSQEIFDHEMEKGSVSDGTRYSLTFRCLSWANKNSMCLIGDSNTRFLKFGSSKRGTFGEQMPGQKFWAPKIEEIDPVSCMGYSNVVLLCGINNIKESHIRSEKDVADCYDKLKCKIKQIKMLNPSVNAVFVCQLLPTKDFTLNRKVNDFNKLLHFDLFPTCRNVEYVRGFEQFVCDHGLAAELSLHLDRHGRLDMLHLNRAGARILAGLIKQSIFLRLHNGVDRRRHTSKVNGRSYSNVVETRLHHSGLADGCQV